MPGQTLEQIKADPEFQALSAADQAYVLQTIGKTSVAPEDVPARERYPAADVQASRATPPGRSDLADWLRIGSSLPPGPIGAATAGAGSLVADLIEGQSPSLGRAGVAAGTTAALGGLGKLAGPLSKLRISGMGRGKDARMVAEAIGEAKPALRPDASPESIQTMMRGQQGKQALSGEFDEAMEGIRVRLPQEPARTVNREGLEFQVFPERPPLSRETFDQTSQEIRRLGKTGKAATGQTRDSAAADTALQSREELIERLKQMLAETDPALLQQYNQARGEYAGGSALRRLFKESSDLSPERVLSSRGLSVRELQDRATKHQARLEAGLGKDKAGAFLKALFRGGAPPMGDKRLAIPLTKLGGFNIPLGLEYLAGPSMDPRLIQMLLQGGGAVGRESLGQ